MPDTESGGDCIREPAIFDNQNCAAREVVKAFQKIRKLLVRLRADRTLRAMLENENGIGFGFVQKFFKITIL